MAEGASSVYLDLSALARLFDDERQLRVRIEADAVRLILSAVERDEIRLLHSVALRMEIDANRNEAQRRFFKTLLADQSSAVKVSLAAGQSRVRVLRDAGLSRFDALHVAFAELDGVDFVTCDDRLLRRLARVGAKVWYGSPVDYCRKAGLL